MSGVYIKNMQMPKHCWQCPFHDEADVCTRLGLSCMKVWGEEKTMPDCPLVPVETREDALKIIAECEEMRWTDGNGN